MSYSVSSPHRVVQSVDGRARPSVRTPYRRRPASPPPKRKRSFREAVPEYRTLLGGVTQVSIDPFLERCFDRWIERWSGRFLSQVNGSEVASYLSEQAIRGFQPKEVQRERLLLDSFYGWACRCGWAERNPVRDIREIPAMPQPRCVAWNGVEQRRLIRACQESRDDALGGIPPYLYPLTLIGLQTGLRVGNLLNLEWRHVNFSTMRLVVPPSEVRTGNAFDAPLSIDALGVLHEMILRAKEMDNLPSRVFDLLGLPLKDGLPDARRVFCDFRHVRRRARVRAGDIHSLRLTFVRNCAHAGVPVEAAAKMADWSDVERLSQIYRRLAPKSRLAPKHAGFVGRDPK